MPPRVELTGLKFGHLIGVRFSHVKPQYRSMWLWQCDCGNEHIAEQYNVRNGNTQSCGCVNGIPVSDPITQGEATKFWAYNPGTGLLTWKVNTHGCYAGEIAGHENKGYVIVCLRDQKYFAHHLIWLLVYGHFPVADIDHRDTDGTNNRLANLRDATRSQNNGNLKRRADNRSGFKGVIAHRDKWCARAKKDGVNYHLGTFSTPEDAARAYDKKAEELFGEFARTNFGENRA